MQRTLDERARRLGAAEVRAEQATAAAAAAEAAGLELRAQLAQCARELSSSVLHLLASMLLFSKLARCSLVD